MANRSNRRRQNPRLSRAFKPVKAIGSWRANSPLWSGTSEQVPQSETGYTCAVVPQAKKRSVCKRGGVHIRLSMTYDQGREMAEHQRLTEATGVKVYFADPHSPWQRGINENTNGLLRQYLPKGDDLSAYTQAQLDAIAWQLNTRPRKSMGFRCPAELFTPDAFDFKQHHAALFALAH